MLSRSLKFAMACAGALAAAAFTVAPPHAHAADECLTAPKGATPAGAHWYYRLEKGTKRKCWYLADEVSKPNRATRAASTPAAAAPEPSNPPAVKSATARGSVADARAELTTPENDQPALAETTWPPLESSEAAASPAADDPAPASETETAAPQSWTMAARWPESSAAATESNGPPDERTAAALRATVAPQERTADSTIGPLRIALVVLTAMLLAAAIVGRLLLRRGRRTKRRGTSRAIWPDERPDNPVVPIAPLSMQPASRARAIPPSPDNRQANTDIAEIESLLRTSRRSTG
jgi:hypothetical protein